LLLALFAQELPPSQQPQMRHSKELPYWSLRNEFLFLRHARNYQPRAAALQAAGSDRLVAERERRYRLKRKADTGAGAAERIERFETISRHNEAKFQRAFAVWHGICAERIAITRGKLRINSEQSATAMDVERVPTSTSAAIRGADTTAAALGSEFSDDDDW
jgi:hypothetical protein